MKRLLPCRAPRSSASPVGDAGVLRARLGVSTVQTLAMIAILAGIPAAAQPSAQPEPFSSEAFSTERRGMIDYQVRRRGIEQSDLLRAMDTVPRHLFVPDVHQLRAYEDEPVEIAPGKTISQAYVSALMISLLDLDGDDKVLEIGTGSGYDAALVSRLARKVYTIEIDRELGDRARKTLRELGYRNVKVKIGDGYRGWPEEAPFDAILLTTAPPRRPEPLIAQLKMGGRMVVPVGSVVQQLELITKTADGLETRKISLVNLAPMTGEVEREPAGGG